jgi:hypothetical protein
MNRHFLERFVARVDDNQLPHDRDILAIAKAFKRILRGEDAKIALGIRRRRGRPARDTADWIKNVLAAVEEVEAKISERKRGVRVSTVVEEIAKKRGLTFEQLARYRKLHRKDVELLS